jgi:hypothetical protein
MLDKKLDKKVAVVVVALVLLGTTMALGATNVIVNGSGTVPNTQPAKEVELIIGQSGTPANILVITQAQHYLFSGTIDSNSVTPIDSTSVTFSVTDSKGYQHSATASKTGNNTWALTGINQDIPVINGHLQINSV